jgi:hypothetical protein
VTEEQAIKLAGSEFWKELTPRQIAEFQLNEPLLCMPFGVFHEAIEKALGRSVWMHEFAFGGLDRMKAELLGERPAPTFEDILALIPEEKRVLLLVIP